MAIQAIWQPLLEAEGGERERGRAGMEVVVVPCWYVVAGQPIDLIPRCNNGLTRGFYCSPGFV